jgi:hypothetical protein
MESTKPIPAYFNATINKNTSIKKMKILGQMLELDRTPGT